MNGKIYSLPVKTAAMILFVIITITTIFLGIIFCLFGTISTNHEDAFYDSLFVTELVNSAISSIRSIYYIDSSNIDEAIDFYRQVLSMSYNDPEKSNLAVEVSLSLNDDAEPFAKLAELPENRDNLRYVKSGKSYFHSSSETVYILSIDAYIRDPFTAEDTISMNKRTFDFLFSSRNTVMAAATVGTLSIIFLYVYIIKAAGRKYGEEGISVRYLNKIPYDIYLFGLGLMTALAVWIVYSVVDIMLYLYFNFRIVLPILLAAAISVLFVIIFLMLSNTTAVRIKSRTIFKNTLIWRICTILWKICRVIARKTVSLVKMLPAVPKAALGVISYIILNAVFISCMFYSYRDVETAVALLIFMAINIYMLIILIRAAYELTLLRKGSAKLADGELDHTFDDSKLHGEAKKISVNLNRLGEGMAAAVESRLKSERMKAELITNVSHDIKTPLTSIINYIDLLKKEDLQSETALEYISVLDRQSARLRKLTSDIIEASKASTGNIDVTLAPTDICELLSQSVAEYADKFAAAELSPIVRAPGTPIVINADGKLLWRVLDNILSNICKYSQPGTRVYLDASSGESFACVSMRNISSAQLDVSIDDLTERFVRGDSSRSGEGSGLGLSIARSLTELQGGRLSLETDGDLFKTSLTFPTFRSSLPIQSQI